MRTLVIMAFATLLSIQSFAQDTGTNSGYAPHDTIRIKTGFWGTYYSINNRPLNNYQLAEAVRTSADARYYMDVAKSYRVASALLAFAGGALLGYQLGNHLTGNPVNIAFLYGGSAVVGLSIPLSISASSYTKKAARIYNNEVTGRISKVQPQLKMDFSGSRVRLALRF